MAHEKVDQGSPTKYTKPFKYGKSLRRLIEHEREISEGMAREYYGIVGAGPLPKNLKPFEYRGASERKSNPFRRRRKGRRSHFPNRKHRGY